MNIPSKIYVRKVHLESLEENNCQLGANIPVGKKPFPMKEDNCVEYTNLSDAWHDAIVEKQPQKVCGNNPVLVVGLRKGRISYRYLWTDMEDLWQDLELLTPLEEKKLYDKVMWAYLKDVVPYLETDF